MPDTIERPEYEARHTELQRQITDMTVELHSIRITLNTLIASNKIAFWKLVATTMIALITGSAGTVIIEAVLRIHP